MPLLNNRTPSRERYEEGNEHTWLYVSVMRRVLCGVTALNVNQ